MRRATVAHAVLSAYNLVRNHKRMRELTSEAEALWRAVEVAHRSDSAEPRVLSMLMDLSQVAPEGTEPWIYAHRELARALASSDPWRASICARRALSYDARDGEAWGIVGLTQSLLDNHEYAVRAYRSALRCDPKNPWYAHNLGHLLDVVFDRHGEAVKLLRQALEHAGADLHPRHRGEMVASLAHALLRMGDVAAAKDRMLPVIQSGLATQAHHALYSQIRTCLEEHVEEALLHIPRSPPTRRVRRRAVSSPS